MDRKWIKIEDQLPKDGERVITYFEHTGIEISTYKNLVGGKDEVFGDNMFHNHSGWLTDDVTHWMPLPEIPKDE